MAFHASGRSLEHQMQAPTSVPAFHHKLAFTLQAVQMFTASCEVCWLCGSPPRTQAARLQR